MKNLLCVYGETILTTYTSTGSEQFTMNKAIKKKRP